MADKYGSRWLALKLLEQDDEILAKVQSREVLDIVDRSIGHLRSIFHDEPEIVLADRRYGFISGACQETIKNSVERRHDVSDTIDAVVTHRVLGLPIFLLLMYVVFQLTFTVGEYPMGWLEWLFGWLGSGDRRRSGPQAAASWLRSLLVDGIIGGVGGVLVFLPNILLLFLAIALLEDTGYMARAAFVMDRIMHKIGLHGKSFIPMLIGFGCSVPAIMATRMLENRRDRLTTIMVIPLMSCGARLPSTRCHSRRSSLRHWRGPVLWTIYLIGIAPGRDLAQAAADDALRGRDRAVRDGAAAVPHAHAARPCSFTCGSGAGCTSARPAPSSWRHRSSSGPLANFPRPSERALAGLMRRRRPGRRSFSIRSSAGSAVQSSL